MFFSSLEDEDFRIFEDLSHSQELQAPGALAAQPVDSDAIFCQINLFRDPHAEPFKLLLVQPALEDGKLDPFAEVLERVGQPGAAAVFPNVVRDDN